MDAAHVAANFAVVVLLFFVVWLGSGLALARKDNIALRESHRLNEHKLAGLASELSHTWRHLPKSLPIDEARRELCMSLIHVLPTLYTISGVQSGFIRRGGDTVKTLIETHPLGISPGWGQHVDALVGKIADPVLSRLWEENDLHSLTMMLRAIVLQPVSTEGFDPAKDVCWEGGLTYELASRARTRA